VNDLLPYDIAVELDDIGYPLERASLTDLLTTCAAMSDGIVALICLESGFTARSPGFRPETAKTAEEAVARLMLDIHFRCAGGQSDPEDRDF
jgi:hypothetical protein